MASPEPSSSPELVAAQAARTIALQMLEERGRGAVLVGVARVDAALEHLLQAVMPAASSKDDGLFLPERPLGSIGAKVALASRLGLIDSTVERALNALRKLRNAFAHSAESASLSDPAHSSRLEGVYKEARVIPLWGQLESALAALTTTAKAELNPDLRNYILLITILVAFLEATAQQLQPWRPPVVMGLSGVSAVNG